MFAGRLPDPEEWEHWLDNKEIGPIAFQFGTRPLLTKESPIGEAWKQRLTTLKEGEIFLNRFSPTGFYSSAVNNEFIQHLRARSDRQVAYTTEPVGEHGRSETVALGSGEERVVVSLGDQMAYLYRGETLVAASTISSGKPGKDTPAGIFSVLAKQPLGHSRKYENAPMPWMQRIDEYGIALHAGLNPGTPASHGCVRLPSAFARKLYSVTDVGTPVLIGA